MSSNAIIKQGELLPAEVAHNPLASALARFDTRKFNLAAPVTAMDSVPPLHRIAVRVVTVNLETETYPIPGPGNKVGLGKTVLDKIAAAGSVSWIPERSGQIDNWNDPHHVKYRAVGELTDFDGRKRVISGEKEIDLRGEKGWDEAELGGDAREFARIAKAKNRDPWNQILQQRQHIHSLAESKAKNRALRSAFAIPISMPPAEAAKPWVVPALVPDLPMDDPEVRRMAVGAILGAQGALYGPRAEAPASLPHDVVDVSEMVEEGEEADETGQDAAPEPVAGDDPWDAPAAQPEKPCHLPISEETIKKVPTNDEKRYVYLNTLNRYADQLVQKLGEDHARAVFLKYGADSFDPLKASLEEIATLGRSLKGELGGAS